MDTANRLSEFGFQQKYRKPKFNPEINISPNDILNCGISENINIHVNICFD